MNQIFLSALHNWQRCDTLRRNRQRFKQYTYGDQWNDLMDDGTGRLRPERELAEECGARPLTNNLIRRIVKTIVGRYRTMAQEQRLYDTNPASTDSLNNLEELDSRLLEEFLISGCAIQRVYTDESPVPGMNTAGSPRVDNVRPNRFFIDSLTDPRGWDARMVGVLHDMPLSDIVHRFCGGSSEKALAIKRIFTQFAPASQLSDLASTPDVGAAVDTHALTDFFTTTQPGKYRVIEVWTLDASEQIICHNPDDGSIAAFDIEAVDSLNLNNSHRRAAGLKPCETVLDRQTHWHCRWFAPDGTLLHQHSSPLSGGQLPFAFKFYPLTDGEVHPFVEDLVSQQKYINRLITLIDSMIGSSAKGVLLFPVNQKPDNISWEQIADQWSKCGGLIPIMGNGTVFPQQIHKCLPDNGGASSLLALELKLFDQISGVTGALMGHEAASATGSSLYEAQTRNAVVALADTFRTFIRFTRLRNNLISLLQCKQKTQ